MERDLRILKLIFPEILEGYFMPKNKIEYNIQLFLSLFIEDFINQKFSTESKDDNWISLLSSEFPFKKENNQSFNADWVLSDGQTLFIIELKTNHSSINKEQIFNYCKVKTTLESTGNAEFLIDDIKKISCYSRMHKKYENLIEKILKKNINFRNVKSVKIIYIVPNKCCVNELDGCEVIFFDQLTYIPQKFDLNYDIKDIIWNEFKTLLLEIAKAKPNSILRVLASSSLCSSQAPTSQMNKI